MVAFIARRSTEFRGFILLVDGKRFGLLSNNRFYSDDAELADAVNAQLRPKYSRNCALACIKRAYVAYLAASQPILDAPKELKAPKVIKPKGRPAKWCFTTPRNELDRKRADKWLAANPDDMEARDWVNLKAAA